MKTKSIRGKTLRWTFTDGPMANKTFEHLFTEKGSVTFRSIEGTTKGKPTEVEICEVAQVSAEVCAVSYMSGGYTLTVVLDFGTGKLFAFSSNEKEMTLQRGIFDEVTEINIPSSPSPHRKSKDASGSSARS
jgi:hypothetical protein